VELVLQRPTPLTLFLPHVTDAPPTQRLLVGPGVMLTLQQLRGISLRKPVDLPHLPPAFVAQVRGAAGAAGAAAAAAAAAARGRKQQPEQQRREQLEGKQQLEQLVLFPALLLSMAARHAWPFPVAARGLQLQRLAQQVQLQEQHALLQQELMQQYGHRCQVCQHAEPAEPPLVGCFIPAATPGQPCFTCCCCC
jgi:hypothetical protein